MNELVSTCIECEKNLYCTDGFFNGIYTEDQQTLCFECAEKREKSAE